MSHPTRRIRNTTVSIGSGLKMNEGKESRQWNQLMVKDQGQERIKLALPGKLRFIQSHYHKAIMSYAWPFHCYSLQLQWSTKELASAFIRISCMWFIRMVWCWLRKLIWKESHYGTMLYFPQQLYDKSEVRTRTLLEEDSRLSRLTIRPSCRIPIISLPSIDHKSQQSVFMPTIDATCQNTCYVFHDNATTTRTCNGISRRMLLQFVVSVIQLRTYTTREVMIMNQVIALSNTMEFQKNLIAKIYNEEI